MKLSKRNSLNFIIFLCLVFNVCSSQAFFFKAKPKPKGIKKLLKFLPKIFRAKKKPTGIKKFLNCLPLIIRNKSKKFGKLNKFCVSNLARIGTNIALLLSYSLIKSLIFNRVRKGMWKSDFEISLNSGKFIPFLYSLMCLFFSPRGVLSWCRLDLKLLAALLLVFKTIIVFDEKINPFVYSVSMKCKLNMVDDINATYNNAYGNKPLHLSTTRYGLEFIRWLVEEKFANIFATKNNGKTAREDLYKTVFGIAIPLYPYEVVINDYLQAAENRHQDLVARVHNLYTDLGVNGARFDDGISGRLEEIKNLIASKRTPGYAKQLVMSTLVEIHENFPYNFSRNEVSLLFEYVAFNYSFLHGDEFKKAVDFAAVNNLRDIDGKTILDAVARYGSHKDLAVYMENNGDLYRSDRLFKNWLANRKGFFGRILESPKKLFSGLKSRLFGINYSGAKKDFANALDVAKRKKKKKVFRDMANANIVLDDLKRDDITVLDERNIKKKHYLPPEIAAKIVGIAGTDFGNKINFS